MPDLTTEDGRTLAVARHLRAISASPVALVYLDSDGCVAFSNEAARSVFGGTARTGERLAIDGFDRTPPFDDTRTSVVARRMATGDHGVYLMSQQPVLMDSGRTERLITAQPLSGEEATELENIRRMHMHEKALEAMSEGVAILDADGRYLYMNAAHARIYGYADASELIGQSWQTLYDAAEQHMFSTIAAPALAADGHWSGDVRGRLKNGTYSIFSVSLSMADEYLVCCCQDVLEHIRQAERLRVIAQHLDDANAELRSAAKLKDEFLATVSHELRSPMHTILGAMELVREHLPARLSPMVANSVDILAESARHLNQLINDLLDVTSIVSKGVTLHVATVPAARVLATAVKLLSERAGSKGVILSSGLNDDAAVVMVDERRLLQVLVNLISNAIDFTDAGGRVHVQFTAGPDACTLTVEDTGCGIAADQLDAIFGKFHQVDRSLSRRHDGTGLGLFVVKEIVSLHGGTVGVTSTVGRGSTFTVTIPQHGTPDVHG